MTRPLLYQLLGLLVPFLLATTAFAANQKVSEADLKTYNDKYTKNKNRMTVLNRKHDFFFSNGVKFPDDPKLEKKKEKFQNAYTKATKGWQNIRIPQGGDSKQDAKAAFKALRNNEFKTVKQAYSALDDFEKHMEKKHSDVLHKLSTAAEQSREQKEKEKKEEAARQEKENEEKARVEKERQEKERQEEQFQREQQEQEAVTGDKVTSDEGVVPSGHETEASEAIVEPEDSQDKNIKDGVVNNNTQDDDRPVGTDDTVPHSDQNEDEPITTTTPASPKNVAFREPAPEDGAASDVSDDDDDQGIDAEYMDTDDKLNETNASPANGDQAVAPEEQKKMGKKVKLAIAGVAIAVALIIAVVTAIVITVVKRKKKQASRVPVAVGRESEDISSSNPPPQAEPVVTPDDNNAEFSGSEQETAQGDLDELAPEDESNSVPAFGDEDEAVAPIDEEADDRDAEGERARNPLVGEGEESLELGAPKDSDYEFQNAGHTSDQSDQGDDDSSNKPDYEDRSSHDSE